MHKRLAFKHLLDRVRYLERKLDSIEALLLCIAERLEQTPTVEDNVEAIKIAIVESGK